MLHALVRHADAVLDNLRGDLPAKLGLTYDALKDANPRVVCAHLSAYGRTGPRADWPGHPSLTPSQLYRTRDGYIFVMCNKAKFWPILCDLIGRPELADHPDFRTFKDRLANRERLTVLLDAALGERTTAEWLARFAGRIPAAPVNDVASALDNPFVRDGGRIWDVEHPERTPFRMVAAPFICPGETLPRHAAPSLGRDTDQVLRDCGISEARIAALRAQGTI